MRATTLGELKKSGYKYQNIKDELRNNLIETLKKERNCVSRHTGLRRHGVA